MTRRRAGKKPERLASPPGTEHTFDSDAERCYTCLMGPISNNGNSDGSRRQVVPRKLPGGASGTPQPEAAWLTADRR